MPERRKASDFPAGVLKLFDGYVHGDIGRREFLDGAAKFAVGGLTAAAMLESLRPNFAWAQQVPRDDARIRSEYLSYPSPQGNATTRGYLTRPAGGGRRAGVVVIHENRGLNPYIEDVARRLAVAGYTAFAPDALAAVGGYPGNEEQAARMFAGLDAARRTEDLVAAALSLKSHPECNGRIAAIGFCFGGGIANLLAVRLPDLAAAVPFYGVQPAAADVARINAPILAHYASNDERINSGIAAFESALKAGSKKYELHIYPNTQHGFHNDTTPRYDQAAAKPVEERTLAFFKEHLM
ncbi:MAG: dienelactone hydrolase family protein [Betaproteobacteria bacterium]|nr:dienelactone hydrolase family protein [Betaproteobacteria bacterium]